VIGTMGQLPEGAVQLIETIADAEAFQPRDPGKLAYTTQTTLSIDDTREILASLKRRFPHMVGPAREDICYATSNRQDAVKAIARRCEAVIVVGAPNSSNSQRLVETAQRAGCNRAFLVQRGEDINFERLGPVRRLGVTAGASAPEILVEEVIESLRRRFTVEVEAMEGEENVTFNLPRHLREEAPPTSSKSFA